MIGKYLKKLRELNGMTQDDVSEILGVTRQSVSKWENEKTYPDIENLKYLSEIYGVSIDDIIYVEKTCDLKKNEEKLENNKDDMFESEWLGWIMVAFVICSAFVPAFGFIISTVFLIHSRKIRQKYLKTLLIVTCIIIWILCFRNCLVLLEVLKRQVIIFNKTGIWIN